MTWLSKIEKKANYCLFNKILRKQFKLPSSKIHSKNTVSHLRLAKLKFLSDRKL